MIQFKVRNKKNIAVGVADLAIAYMKEFLDNGRSAKNDTFALRRSLRSIPRGLNTAIIAGEEYLNILKRESDYSAHTKTMENGFVEEAFEKVEEDDANFDKILNEWVNELLK